MQVSRRNLLGVLLRFAPVIISSQWLKNNFAQTIGGANKPLVNNHSPSGQAIVSEGKTLLATFSFPSPIADINGSLPIEIEPGSTSEARLTEPQPLYFYPAGDSRTFHTMISAPLDAIEGSRLIYLSAKESNNSISQWSFPYSIRRGSYRRSALTLDKNFSAPPPDVTALMRRDFETMVNIYRQRTLPAWRESFVLPVMGQDRGNFGDYRVVNRTKHYRHSGLDFHAPYDTPVRAINSGKVVISAVQWVAGETICLDHGGGVFSKYLHLSQRLVKEGDNVARGQILARSGNSGGQKPPPHLHLDLIVNGIRVDPKDFMRTAVQLRNLLGSKG